MTLPIITLNDCAVAFVQTWFTVDGSALYRTPVANDWIACSRNGTPQSGQGSNSVLFVVVASNVRLYALETASTLLDVSS